ncbi:MAG TPA: carbohydrate-binding protein [Polyangia bacterium]|nr:carbohydrate-binding protein [Polyangia bacterium]
MRSIYLGRVAAACSLFLCLACVSNATPNGGAGGSGTGGSGGSATGGVTGAGGTQAAGGSTGQGGATGQGGSSGATGQGGSSGATGSGGAAPTGPYTWKNVAIGGGGFVSGIVFSPAQNGLVYARTDVGGFYRSTDGGAHWTPLTDQYPASLGSYLGGESIAPDPTDASIVYAAAGMYESAGATGVILRSTDQGASWTVNAINLPMGGNDTGRGMGERLAVDPNNDTILYFGSRGSGLYKSTNSGTSWSKVTAFPTTGDVAASGTSWGLPVVVFDKGGGSAAGSKTIYVAAATTAAGSNLYQSTDGGATWAEIAGGPTGLMAHHAAVGSDGTVWLAYGNNYGPYNTNSSVKLVGQVWKYASSGGWTNVTPPSTNWGGMAGGISVDAQDPTHVIVSTLDWYAPDRLLMTKDAGATWSVIGQPPISGNTAGSTYDDQGAAYWYSANPQLIGTNATNWVEAVALDPFNPNHAMHGTGSGIWSSSNIGSATGANGQGITWTFSDTGLEETVPQYMMPSVNGAFLGAIGDLGGMRNTDLDSYSTSGQYTNPSQSNVTWIDFAESNPKFVVRVGNSGKVASDVAYSTDNGVTWMPCATAVPGYTTANKTRSVAVAADGSRFVVAPSSVTAAVTTDDGTTWTAVTGLPAGATVAADRVTAETFYAVSGTTFYASTDGGMTFASAGTLGTGKGGGAPRPVFGQAGEVWVASGGSLYRFGGAGVTKAAISNITSVTGVGFGAPVTAGGHPVVFAIGTVGTQYGFWRSDDGTGSSWTRMNDDAHQFGSLQGNYIGGDETVVGRVFLTTGGRGYVYGDPN